MKKRFFAGLIALVFILLLGIFPTVSADETETADSVQISASRFENMLNNNYVYGNEFDSMKDIISLSQISLLDMADDDGKLDNKLICDFVKSMYGIDLILESKAEGLPIALDKKTEITPRGFTKYFHKVTDIKENPDGTVTVYSDVSEKFHDGGEKKGAAVSVFAKDDESDFGYILFSCELVEPK